MAEPYLGEIRPFAFGNVPTGWQPCQGQTMMINQNQALYALLGTVYGGNGTTNFMLPDLRGRTPIHRAQAGGQLGGKGGSETVTLTSASTPAHTHAVLVNTAAGTDIPPANDMFAGTSAASHLAYGAAGAAPVALNALALDPNGSNTPHANMQPFQVIAYCIAMTGLFPMRP